MRWFIDVVGDQFPDFPRSVNWLQWDQQETWQEYICRARRDAPYGLVHGKFQVGIRLPDDDARLVPVSSHWWMETTPRFWDLDQATALAESLGFTSVDMISKAQRRRGAAWLFKAFRPDGLDYAQTQIDDYEIQVIKDAKRKPTAHSIRPLASEGRIKFHAGPTTSVETLAPDDTVSEKGPDDTLEDRDIFDTDAKRPRVEVELPDSEMHNAIWSPAMGNIVANDGQGDCLWYSLAAALSHHSGKTRYYCIHESF